MTLKVKFLKREATEKVKAVADSPFVSPDPTNGFKMGPKSRIDQLAEAEEKHILRVVVTKPKISLNPRDEISTAYGATVIVWPDGAHSSVFRVGGAMISNDVRSTGSTPSGRGGERRVRNKHYALVGMPRTMMDAIWAGARKYGQEQGGMTFDTGSPSSDRDFYWMSVGLGAGGKGGTCETLFRSNGSSSRRDSLDEGLQMFAAVNTTVLAMLTLTMTYSKPNEAMAKTFTLSMKATRVTLLGVRPGVKPPALVSSGGMDDADEFEGAEDANPAGNLGAITGYGNEEEDDEQGSEGSHDGEEAQDDAEDDVDDDEDSEDSDDEDGDGTSGDEEGEGDKDRAGPSQGAGPSQVAKTEDSKVKTEPKTQADAKAVQAKQGQAKTETEDDKLAKDANRKLSFVDGAAKPSGVQPERVVTTIGIPGGGQPKQGSPDKGPKPAGRGAGNRSPGPKASANPNKK